MKCGVIGATGYLGAELLRLLADHPSLDVALAQADSTAGSRVGEIYPGLARVYGDLTVESLDPSGMEHLDAVFVALPSGMSQDVVAALLPAVGLVVDLGADFRLKDASCYPRWYGFEHRQPDLLAKAVYGLPELNRRQLPGAGLIAAPGCYVTAAAVGLRPLVASGLLETHGIVVDGVSGTSGAGKSLADELHHPVANERFVAYKLLDHRHTPEMEQVLGAEVLFTPHLAPMTRGILTTSYARPARPTSTEEVMEVLSEAIGREPFVNLTEGVPSTADAYGSNVVHVTARADDRTGWVVVIAAIDNLVKGGAGQAIQAANVALGFPETSGLPLTGLSP